MNILTIILMLFAQLQPDRGEEYYRKDYSDHWIVYDKGSGQYVPLLSNPDNEKTVHFYLDLQKDLGKNFELCWEEGISIFINGEIVDRKRPSACLWWPIDSLRQEYKSDSIQVTIYQRAGLANLRTSMLYPALGFVPEENPVKLRVENRHNDFILFALIVMGIVLVLIREYNYRFFEEFASFQKTFALRVRSNPLYNLKPFSREILQMAVIESLCISFFAISLGQFFPEVSGFMTFDTIGFWNFVIQWLLWAVVFLVVIYLQFLLLFLINLFFRNAKLLYIQFYDNLRITFFYLSALLFLLMGVYALSTDLFQWIIAHLWMAIIVMYLLKSMIIYLKMLSESSHRRLHIFSYFCATEILPIALVVKIVFY